MPETHSAPLSAELAPAPALETSTVAEPRVDSALGSAACSAADQRVTEGRPESVEVVTLTLILVVSKEQPSYINSYTT